MKLWKESIICGILVGIGVLLYLWGVHNGKKQIYTELNVNQKITQESQKDLTESLKNQIRNIEFTNKAHGITVEMEKERWLSEIKVEVEG